MENLASEKKFNERRLAAVLLIVIGIIGSVVTFYNTNLLFSDLSNMFYGTHDAYIIASFPGFTWCLYFVLAEIFVFRYFYRPKYRKSLVLLYLIIAGAFAIFGIVMSILTGAIIYKDFFAPWPFPGYTFISLISHILILGCSIFLWIKFKKELPEDEKKRPISFQYVGFSVVLSLLTWFAFERFGAFICAPIYLHWRTLYLTWPFYISLLLPMAELVHTVLYMFDYFRNRPKIGVIYSYIMIGVDVLSIGAVIILGMNFPQFISAVSPALALERLAAMPVDIILTAVVMILFTGYNLVYSLYRYKKSKVQN